MLVTFTSLTPINQEEEAVEENKSIYLDSQGLQLRDTEWTGVESVLQIANGQCGLIL